MTASGRLGWTSQGGKDDRCPGDARRSGLPKRSAELGGALPFLISRHVMPSLCKQSLVPRHPTRRFFKRQKGNPFLLVELVRPNLLAPAPQRGEKSPLKGLEVCGTCAK